MENQGIEVVQNYAAQNTERFIVHIKLKDVHADLAGDAEARFDTSN